MKSAWIAILALLLSSFALAASPPDRSDQMELQGKQFVRVDEKWFVESSPDRWFEVVPDVVTVKFNKQTPKASETAILRAHGSSAIRRNRLGAVDIKVPRGLDPVKFVEILQKSGKFEYAEVNTIGQWEYIPDDTQFTDQWGLDNTGQTGGTTDADVDAPEAWDLEVGSPSVLVAVLDSGTDYDHEDLECNIWVNPGEDLGNDGIVMDPADINGVDDDGNGFIDDLIGWDFDGGDNDPAPTNDHGTHVAGIIGACGDNAQGVIGVAGGTGPGTGAKMAVLLIGNTAPNSAILDDAIIYAADNGAHVIALSLSVGQSTPIDDALEYAYDTMGVLVVNASGNNNSSVGYPATNTHVMAVGSTNHDDIRAANSNFGPELEVVAPGVTIMSTTLADTYGNKSGTSMASPHVSGTAALMFSAAPAATNQEVRDCITITAEDEVGDPAEDTAGRDDFHGFGRLNTADALICIAFNDPPVCDANGPYSAECNANTDLDGTGSTDPNGDSLLYTWSGPFTDSPVSGATPTVVFPPPLGGKSVDLIVDDTYGGTDSCSAPVTVQDTLDPSITAPGTVQEECTSPGGTPAALGSASASDLCDASPTVTNNAPPLFPLGDTTVTWKATDDSGNFATDDQTVTIVDTTPPVISCNAPPTITPPDAPISFTATVDDICDAGPTVEVVAYDCYKVNKKGKRIGKKASCVVTFEGDSVTILDTGGVSDHITWTVQAADESGNTAEETCEVVMVNPAQ